MTREEAAEFTRKLVARAETIVFPKTPKTINNIPVFYFEAVLSALRGPQPQPAQPEAGSPTTTQHCPEQASNTRQLADTDACDRLRWLLTQAECAGVPVGKEDREAVRMAIDILKKG